MPEPNQIQEPNPTQGLKQPARSAGKIRNTIIHAVFIVFVIAFAFVYYYYHSAPAVPTTTVPPTTTIYTTTIAPSFLSNLTGYLATFSRNNAFPLSNLTSNGDENVSLVNVSGCGAILTTAYYLGSNFSLSHPLNFSRLSATKPFFEYISIETYNQTVAPRAMKLFNSNGGFCDKTIFSLVISNSTYSSTPTSVDGNPAYILKFSNLTPAGISYAIASSGYAGKAPSNIDYYMVATMYKNVDIEVGDEGFSQSMNVSRLVIAANTLLQNIKPLILG